MPGRASDYVYTGAPVIVAGTTIGGTQVVAKGYLTETTLWSGFDNHIEVTLSDDCAMKFWAEDVKITQWEDAPERPGLPDPRKEITP